MCAPVRGPSARAERLRAQVIEVTGAYLEIYNENLRDLVPPARPLARPPSRPLTRPPARSRPLARSLHPLTARAPQLNESPSPMELREDPVKGVSVAGVTEYRMETAADVFRILERGAKHRTTDSHSLNEASSRSHAVLMIGVAQSRREGGQGVALLEKQANLTMIDLAGSERAKKAQTNKKQLREGANINRSLLALANCINALGQHSRKKGLYAPPTRSAFGLSLHARSAYRCTHT